MLACRRLALFLVVLLGFFVIRHVRAATDIDIPTVVSDVSYANVSSSMTTTTLYTPAGAGNYELLVYGTARETGNAGNSSVSLLMSWSDEYNGYSQQTPIGPGGTGVVYASSVQVIHSAANQPIQVSWTYNAGTAGLSYDIHVTVVKE